MAKSLSNRHSRSSGFTLIEMMIAMFIFAIGILSLAALMAAISLSTARSRYVSTATTLVTEKLEDINRYAAADTTDTAVTVGGSLTSDLDGYYDTVQVQSSNGTVTEITHDPDLGCYDVFVHSIGTTASPGTATDSGTTPCLTSAPASTAGAVTFRRRWLVEGPITISGNSVAVRRVTVWISLWSQSANQATNYQGLPVTYQLSTVRP